MSNLTATSAWIDVYQLERTDPVDAGISGDGVSNLQAQQLLNRTQYLYDTITSILAGTILMTASPPQFDDTKKISTTEWVNDNMGRFSDIFPGASGPNLTVAHIGKLVLCENQSTGVMPLVLPTLSSVPPGTGFHIKVSGIINGVVTVTTSGSNKIYNGGNATPLLNTTVVTLCNGDLVSFIRSQDNTALGTSTPYWVMCIHAGNFNHVGEICLKHNQGNTGAYNISGLPCDGNLYVRAQFPRLWAYINSQTSGGASAATVSEATWQSNTQYQGKFSTGTITTGVNANFRMPLLPFYDTIAPLSSAFASLTFYCKV